MTNRSTRILATALAVTLPAAAAAHHGWGWTEAEETRLSGTIESITFGNPHMHLQVRSERNAWSDGALWEVDLSPPIVAEQSGFGPEHAEVGDEVVLTGHRARDPDVRSFKGETITVGGRTFDVYPQREKSLDPEA